MLAAAAIKIKALNAALSKPFVTTAGKLGWPGREVSAEGARFSASFTRSRRDILRAQRLRYRVFSEEYGASFDSPFGLDRDRFDKHCLHLVVRDNSSGELVGYTRVLMQHQIVRTGGFYSESEFDLSMLTRLPGRVAEIGRTCIHPDYRNGAVITVMWSRLAQFMVDEQIDYLIGCASVALNEGFDVGAIIGQIRDRHLSDPALRAQPLLPLESLRIETPTGRVRMPPLLKAYLRMGAQVCGEPCWDPDFNCLDFFILMARDQLPQRYVQHFLQAQAA